MATYIPIERLDNPNLSIGIICLIVVLAVITSIAKANRLKDKATAEILRTPISSLVEEELEGLKDKYSDEK